MPVVAQRIPVPLRTPLAVLDITRSPNNCIIGTVHDYGYFTVSWTFVRNMDDTLASATALVQDA